jgi:hypothetical protein
MLIFFDPILACQQYALQGNHERHAFQMEYSNCIMRKMIHYLVSSYLQGLRFLQKKLKTARLKLQALFKKTWICKSMINENIYSVLIKSYRICHCHSVEHREATLEELSNRQGH